MVTLSDGRSTICNDDHLWTIYDKKHDREVTYSTREMMDYEIKNGRNINFRLTLPDPVEYSEKELPVHPYVYGVLQSIGVVNNGDICITTNNKDLANKVAGLIDDSNVNFTEDNKFCYFSNKNNEFITDKVLFSDKEYIPDRIPNEIKLGSIQQRIEYLQGLFDSKGNLSLIGELTYSTYHKEFAEDLIEVFNSLGIPAQYLIDKHDIDTYRVWPVCAFEKKMNFISLPNLTLRLKNWIKKMPKGKYKPARISIVDIRDMKVKTEMQCIYVDDPEHLYLTEKYIPTHNTTLGVQIAANIVRPFKSGVIQHYDLEGSSNMTRIGNITKFNALELKDKYILKNKDCAIEDIKLAIGKIYQEKVNNPSLYGKLNEFGKPIITYEPTVILIDSVPSMGTRINENTKDGIARLEEVSTQTDRMRITAEIGRFLNESLLLMKNANIIMILINHVKEKPGMGVPQAPEIRGLKQNETLPSGKSVHYYSSTMIRLTPVGAEKYTPEEHGFDGFGVQVKYIKNRSNADQVIVPMVFDKGKGYDSVRSSVMFAKEMGLLGGNRNGYYFINNKDKKFRFDTIHEEFMKDRELYKIMYAHIIPVLEHMLSSVKPEELSTVDEEMDY